MTTNRASGSARGAERKEQSLISTELLKSSFERVFLEQYPRVYAVLVQIVGDRAEAEDLALETFWQLRRRPPVVGQTQSLGGWLYRVATNLGLNSLRARKRRERYELEAGADALMQGTGADPEQAAAAEEEREQVRQILGKMDARRAQLLLMRHSGLTYEELASALGISPNSIGTLLVRAEREFVKKWQESGYT